MKHHIKTQVATNTCPTSPLMDILAPLQTSVLRRIGQYKKEVNCWERIFFSKNNFSAPVMSDRQKDCIHLDKYNRMKVGEKLLKYWNINL